MKSYTYLVCMLVQKLKANNSFPSLSSDFLKNLIQSPFMLLFQRLPSPFFIQKDLVFSLPLRTFYFIFHGFTLMDALQVVPYTSWIEIVYKNPSFLKLVCFVIH